MRRNWAREESTGCPCGSQFRTSTPLSRHPQQPDPLSLQNLKSPQSSRFLRQQHSSLFLFLSSSLLSKTHKTQKWLFLHKKIFFLDSVRFFLHKIIFPRFHTVPNKQEAIGPEDKVVSQVKSTKEPKLKIKSHCISGHGSSVSQSDSS